MSTIDSYFEMNRGRLGEWVRSLVGTAEQPAPLGRALLLALARPLAESGLLLQAPTRPDWPLVASGGPAGARRLTMLVQLDQPAPTTEPSSGRAGLVAFLMALAALRATGVPLPLPVQLVGEPDRAQGSRSLERLALAPTDLCLWDGGGSGATPAWVALGSHGHLHLRLEATGQGGPLSLGGVVANPAWRLTWALALLKNMSEAAQPAALYEPIRSPTATELAVLAQRGPALAELITAVGATPLLGLSATQLPLVQAFSPALNLTDLRLETTTPGALPRRASAELTMTLIPRQTPQAVVAALREHLASYELADVAIEIVTAYDGHETAQQAPLVQIVSQLMAAESGTLPLLLPFAEQPAPLSRLATGGALTAVGLGPGRLPWSDLEDRVIAQARLLTRLLPQLTVMVAQPSAA